MNVIGLVESDVCNRDGCKGVMQEQDTDTCCSCHISPPCSHCTDAIFECVECGEETENPNYTSGWEGVETLAPVVYKSTQERFDELEDGKFDYVTIAGQYYWMEYWGKTPEGMTADELIKNFNVCFGFQWIKRLKDQVFHIKVYTD